MSYDRAMTKLQQGASRKDCEPTFVVTLTALEADAIVKHMQWLSRERDALIDSMPED